MREPRFPPSPLITSKLSGLLVQTPDDAGLTAGSLHAAVREELAVAAGRAQIDAVDVARQQPGLLQLPAGQAPQVHGAALGVEPGAELVAPLAFEVDDS